MSTQIVKYGNPILHEVCEQADITDANELKKTIALMQNTMIIEQGVGLAANQIGINSRIFVWDYQGKTGHIINPQLQISEERFDTIEGCLSCDRIPVKLSRAYKCELSGYNHDGEWITVKADGVLASIFQHEFDHLNGKTIIDTLNRAQRRKLFK